MKGILSLMALSLVCIGLASDGSVDVMKPLILEPQKNTDKTNFGWFSGYHPQGTPAPQLSATIILYLSIPLFLYGLFKWAGTREYDVPVEHHSLTRYDNGFMGMAWFILSEISLFGVLIAGYVYLRVTGHADTRVGDW